MPNQKRQRLPIPWGAGVDRASGAMAVDPTAFRDLRNVGLGRARVELRTGYERMLALTADDMILGVFPIRAQGLAALISYNSGARTVNLYVTDATGLASAFVSALYVLPDGATAPPSIVAAASYDKLVIAHDEPVYAKRQATMVYSPTEGTVEPLLADFAREGGTFPVKFRGVASYLSYILGWGYGQHNTDPAREDEDRPETLRISDPGEPTTFQPEHYFLVGQQGDPIIGGGKAGGVYALFKAAESYVLKGYDRTSFGIVPLDPQAGLLASKLTAAVGTSLYFWSLGGPRVTNGAGSDDLAAQLWLAGPPPDPAADATPLDRAFAYYDPKKDEVHFVFGQWVYVLHRAYGDLRWSYRKLAIALTCAGLVYTGGTSLLTPPPGVVPGTASYVDPSYTPGDADPLFYIPWTWSPASPGQRAEVWVKESGGAWAMRANVPASNGFALLRVPDGKFLEDYEAQVRFTQFGIPSPGYEDPDPSMWPVGSHLALTAVGTPAFFALGRYHRYSPTEIGFNAGVVRGPGVNQASPATYAWEADYSLDLATWTPITLAATPPWNELRIPNSEATHGIYVRIRATRAGAPLDGGYAVSSITYLKPEPPTGVVCGVTNNPGGPNDDTDGHTITWGAPAVVAGPVQPNDGPYDVRGRHYDTLAFIGPWSSIDAVGFGVHAHTMNIPGVDPSTSGSRTCEVQVRSNNGLGDVSDWVGATSFEP